MTDPIPEQHDAPDERLGRSSRWFLAGVVLFLGGSGLVYEYCLSTVATHLLGNSIEQFSVIIALMLFAMGLAGVVQRGIHDVEKLASIFVVVEILIGFIGGISAVLLYVAFAHLEHFRLVLYALAMSIGFGIGMEIPLLMRINQRWQPELRHNVGQILSLDYLGALGGALIWAFLLLPLFSLDRISLFLGLVNLAIAVGTLLVFWNRIRRRGAIIALLVGCVACLGATVHFAPAILEHSRQRLYAYPIRHHIQSPYQDIVIAGSGEKLAMYLNGRLQLDSEDEYIYHETLVHPALMALGRPPRDVLILGGGDGMAVREVLKWPSVRRITLVDLDPAVTALAKTHAGLVALNEGALSDRRVRVEAARGVSAGAGKVDVVKEAERPRLALARHREIVATVKVLNLDADLFIHDLPSESDVIIADFPDPRSPDLAKLFSLEFYLKVKSRLRPGGVLALQGGSPYTTRRAFWCIRDTLIEAGLSVLPLQAHVPTFGAWGFLLARKGAAPKELRAPPVPTRYLTGPVMATAMIFAPPMARPPGMPRCVSTRLDPRVMRYYLAGEPIGGPRMFPGSSTR